MIILKLDQCGVRESKMSITVEKTMVQVTLDDIVQDLRTYLQRVESGETVVVLKAGQPVAEIKPITTKQTIARPYGLCAGEFTVPDDFDAPLPTEILQTFEQ
jgi:antitoxin (DNA-binding transcriptional repressor) of toxin-antitoxin stability system